MERFIEFEVFGGFLVEEIGVFGEVDSEIFKTSETDESGAGDFDGFNRNRGEGGVFGEEICESFVWMEGEGVFHGGRDTRDGLQGDGGEIRKNGGESDRRGSLEVEMDSHVR